MSATGPPSDAPGRQDRRIRRTRRALGDALIGLLAEKPYESVTIQDVLDRADVGRSTFYSHFTDKHALLLEAYRQLRQESASEGPPARGRETFGWSLQLLHQLQRARSQYVALLGDPGCLPVIREVEREVDALVRADLARLAGVKPRHVPDMVVRFVVTAFMTIMPWWLRHPKALSVEEVHQAFRVLTLPGAAAALGRTVRVGPPPAALARVALGRS